MARLFIGFVFIAFIFSQVNVEIQGLRTKNTLLKNVKPIPAKTYVLNLDLPPIERWNAILKDGDKHFIQKGMEKLVKRMVPIPELQALSVKLASKLDILIPQPFSDEIRGISKFTGIPLGDVVLANIIYDLNAYGSANNRACTSIVTTDQSGRIIQGRNLDYIMANILRKIAIQVDFQRGGKSLFMATTYMSYVGVITGCKHGAFSISGNERDSGTRWENLLSALTGSQVTFFNERTILENAESYKVALKMATTIPTVAPVYFILGGLHPGEGAIVVREGRCVVNVTSIGDDPKHLWFIVETNYDPWKNPPTSDGRRNAAIRSMDKVGPKNMTSKKLYEILSMPPVFNNYTTYTTIMSAADSSVYQTMIRFDHP